ncbi:MAG: AAA-like domain-containing protein [Microcoleaceae cyanobacterium]
MMNNLPNSQNIIQTAEPENPGAPISINSKFYIARPPCEERVYAEIAKPGSLIRIRSPKKMGKTSLMLRLINQAKNLGYRTINLDFRETDTAFFESTEKFLRWFCISIARQLKMNINLDDYWDEDLGHKVCCTLCFEEFLEEIDTPLVLTLKEVNCVFKYPKIAQDFLPLLRFWHEQARMKTTWEKLRLVIVHSIETYVSLSVHQSPFNVGLVIKLPEFTPEQVQDLAQRYGLKLTNKEIQELMAMVGGHPYLIHIALDSIYHHNFSMEKLLKEAPTQTGIYCDYLRSLWVALQKQPALAETFHQVITNSENIQVELDIAYQLESLGLVKFEGNICVPSCQLYSVYFQGQNLAEKSAKTIKYNTTEKDYKSTDFFPDINKLNISNRSLFNSCIQAEWNRMVSESAPISLVLCEIDNYQTIQDKYGTEFSRKSVEIITKTIYQILQGISNVYMRNYNEEFFIILPKINAAQAIDIAETIQQKIKELTLSPDRDLLTNFPNFIVTTRMGIAAVIPSEEHEPNTLFLAADEALYESKENGHEITVSSFLNY